MTIIPDSLRIVELGPSIGRHHDRDIPAYYITATGQRSDFVRVAVEHPDGGCELSQCGPRESIIAPGLVYRAVRP